MQRLAPSRPAAARLPRWTIAASLALATLAAPAHAASVTTYHNTPNRSGHYVVPGLTLARAASLTQDSGFTASFSGKVYAQPLYDEARRHLIVATTSNTLLALDAGTGAQAWSLSTVAPAPLSALPCGDIDPEGIVGTPVITTAGIFFNVLTLNTARQPRHMVYAADPATGRLLAGWPLDIQALLTARGSDFSAAVQGQRGALATIGDKIYIPYGGKAGDCGNYRGTVVEIDPASRTLTSYFQTRAFGGGIWTPGGLARAGQTLLATTGNTKGASSWSDGEAVIRLAPGLARPTGSNGYYTPSNWQALDNSDLDLGGTVAIPLTVGSGTGAPARTIAFGKDGNAYLLNSNRLGGTGGEIAKLAISRFPIITAPAVLTGTTTTTVFVTNFSTTTCSGSNVTALTISRTAPYLSIAWCQLTGGNGAPIVTTSGAGTQDAIVWVAGAEGDNKLHGFNALTGAPVYTSPAMTGLRHFMTPMAANGRLYLAADGRIYAYRLP